jgi:hypothetical protein
MTNDIVLAHHQADELADILGDIARWLTDAPPRTRRELADHTDPCWSNQPGTQDAYATTFINRLHHHRQLILDLIAANPNTTDYRPTEPTQPHPGRGNSMIDTGENPRSAATSSAASSRPSSGVRSLPPRPGSAASPASSSGRPPPSTPWRRTARRTAETAAER